ncbi:hypothetical protein [Actinacidiphila soli]|uniref:hypothetical protein n=1 Tax=Actinacidiphila soli TaxID=2487275 RepID=UPI0013E3F657|nr:hypothetical protein [Actinacidiphila soli]
MPPSARICGSSARWPGCGGRSALRAALHGATGETLRACALLAAFALVFGALAVVRAGRGWSRSAEL